MWQEFEDRELRKNNLVFQNVPEPNPTYQPKKELFETELKKVHKLCEVLKINFRFKNDVKFIYRAGEMSKDGQPRPMIVGF